MSNSYRLIWFQHFHKAAGTSVVDAAQQNGETLFPNHQNGNPVDHKGQQIKLWNFTPQQLTNFINDCEQQGITFVATEWGVPNVPTLKADLRVVTISCLRDPLDRFVSNFYFDLYHGFTNARTLFGYVATRNRTITMHNYYCRLLSGHDNSTSDVDKRHFDQALSTLQQFDCVVNLKSGLTPLARYLGWHSDSKLRINKSENKLKLLLGLAVRGHWKLLYLRFRFPRIKPSDTFIAHFAKNNLWDNKLLEKMNSSAAS